MKFRVSINILNYNTFEKSCICIDSCLKQKGVDYRILLVDNCSSDDSYLKLRALYGDKIQYLQTNHNYGFAKGNNISVYESLQSGYNVSLLLNSDTELIGQYLLRDLLDTMNSIMNCNVVSPVIFDVTHEGFVLHSNDSYYLKALRFFNVLPNNKEYGDFAELSEAHGSAMLVKNEEFLKVGGFPEHYFMYGEESTFAKKILWSGSIILGVKNSKNYILHHHDKSNKIEGWRLYLMARNRGLEYFENRHVKSFAWDVVMFSFLVVQFIRCVFVWDWTYMIGIRDSWLLFKNNGVHYKESCFEQAVSKKKLIKV